MFVSSEVGPLREVIVHSPGVELLRLTPETKEELLFDDLLWVRRAQEEHQQFREVLNEAGAEVLQLDQLLAETLRLSEARGFLLKHTFDERRYGPAAAPVLHQLAAELEPAELTGLIIGGLTKRELLERVPEPKSMMLHALGLDELVVAPLPNHLFTRDASCWVYDGVAVNAMQKPARVREALTYETIYRWHPRFAQRSPLRFSDGLTDAQATVEGGDVLVLGDGAVLVGMSERSTAAGVERLARKLFAAGSADRVVVLALPRAREFMHLDTVMTMVDERSFIEYAGLGSLPSYTITPAPGSSTDALESSTAHPGTGAVHPSTPASNALGSGQSGKDTRRAVTNTEQVELQIQDHPPGSMHAAIAEAMGRDDLRILTPEQDVHAAAREQWDDGCNALALAPGVVITYDRTPTSNAFLREAGIEVYEVPGGELGRGRGGPRCMSCPTLRESHA